MCAHEFGLVSKRYLATVVATPLEACVFGVADAEGFTPCSHFQCGPEGDMEACLQITAEYTQRPPTRRKAGGQCGRHQSSSFP